MEAGAIVVCSWAPAGAAFPEEAAQALTLGRRVAAASGAPLGCLLLGPAPDEHAAAARRYGAGTVDRIPDERLTATSPDRSVAALAQYCAARRPSALLFSQTFDVRLLAPRLAGRLGCGVVMNGLGLTVENGRLLVEAASFGSATRSVYRFGAADPQIVALLPNAVLAEPAPDAATDGPVEEIAVDLDGVDERIRVVERAAAQGARLENARIIVAGGRGLRAAENFTLIEQLAEALGGVPGASRPIVDDGWVDAARQVGLTGKVVSPDLYIAAGISGASQHMAGCSAAKTIVAINADADAAIFRYARYGIVADALKVLPELIRLARGRD
jgi:electron transfer flavoprotein alpha subunit